MAVRVWLDKDGKVLVSPEGNVYLSEECCCLKKPDPTICWQLYSATVTTSEDGSSKGWSEPWMVDYTCLVSGSEPPGAAEWRYAQVGATRWVSFLGMCSECSVPHGADKPGLNVECTQLRLYMAEAGLNYSTLYMGVATVITYAVVRDENGVSVGQEVAGSTVVPNWRLTEVTPDDSDDFKYSQTLGDARRVYAPVYKDSAVDKELLDPYYYSRRGSTWVTNSYVVYSGGYYPIPLENGVSLLTAGARAQYATGGQGLMSLTQVGSRFSAVPCRSTGMTSRSSLVCEWVHTMVHFDTDQWGRVEFAWSPVGDAWYRPYIHVTAHRAALGGMTPVSNCSRYERAMPIYMSQSMAPLWREYVWVSNSVPLAEAADHAIAMALSGVDIGTPGVTLYGVKCNTWWFRLIGESWDGCPIDVGYAFGGWSRLWSSPDTPEYRYLDTLIPVTVNTTPFGINGNSRFHEDDDALAQGSTVFRAFSSELGDGHCYALYRLNIHNFPSWRTDLCPAAFEPVSAEVPNLIWKGSDFGKRSWAYANEQAGVGGAWPIQSFWINASSGAGWFTSQASIVTVPDYYTRFMFSSTPTLPGVLYNGGEKLYSSQVYKVYNLAGGYQTVTWGPCLVVTDVGGGHLPGAQVALEALEEGGTYQYTSMVDGTMVTTKAYNSHSLIVNPYDSVGLDGEVMEAWKGCDIRASENFGSLHVEVDPNRWYRIWTLDSGLDVCADGGYTYYNDSRPTSGMPGSLERLFALNQHIPRNWWQDPAHSYVGGLYDINDVYTYLGTAGYAYDYIIEADSLNTYSQAESGSLEHGYRRILWTARKYQGGTGERSIEKQRPGTIGYHQYVTMLDGYNSVLVSCVCRGSAYSSWSTSYHDLTTIYESWYTEHCTVNSTWIGNGSYGSLYLYRLPIASGGWAPSLGLYRPASPDGANLISVGGTEYRTTSRAHSYQYTTTITHADDSKELVTRWSYVNDNNTESAVVDYNIEYPSRWLGDNSFALVTLGDRWTPPGYIEAGAVVTPGKATQVYTSGRHVSTGFDPYMGNSQSFAARDLVTVMKWGEASIKGGQD